MIKLVLKLVVKVKVTKLVLKLVLKLILKLVLKFVLLIKGWLMFCALGRPAASPNLDGKCGRWPHFPSRFPRQRVAIFLPPTDACHVFESLLGHAIPEVSRNYRNRCISWAGCLLS